MQSAITEAPRYTGDIDLFVRPSEENSRRILAALADFGFGSLNLQASDFDRPGRVVQLGYPPCRVDLVTSIEGVSFDEANGDVSTGPTGTCLCATWDCRFCCATREQPGARRTLPTPRRLTHPIESGQSPAASAPPRRAGQRLVKTGPTAPAVAGMSVDEHDHSRRAHRRAR
jgi:hypothetical protein